MNLARKPVIRLYLSGKIEDNLDHNYAMLPLYSQSKGGAYDEDGT